MSVVIKRAMSSCVFCKMVLKTLETKIIYEDEDFLVFPDRSPVSAHHYLIIPKIHYKNVKTLTPNDIPMIHKMEEIGRNILQEKGADEDDAILGFHWPIYTVEHLHLHAISPASPNTWTSLLKRVEFSSWFFGNVEDAVKMIKNKS